MTNLILALAGVAIITSATWVASRLWARYDKEVMLLKKRISLIYLVMVIFPVLLLGAFLSTYNWNAYFRIQERTKQKKAVAQMLEVENTINKITCSDFINERKSTIRGQSEISIPKFHTSVLTSVMATGLFNDEKDSRLNAAIITLSITLDEANNRINMEQTLIMQELLGNPNSKINYIDFIKDWAIINKAVGPGIDSLESILQNNYGVSKAASFLYPDDIRKMK